MTAPRPIIIGIPPCMVEPLIAALRESSSLLRFNAETAGLFKSVYAEDVATVWQTDAAVLRVLERAIVKSRDEPSVPIPDPDDDGN